eukprot:scaffold2908_cov257-Pinguiococcus_pyrenoidosus.AAC.3
MPLFHPRKSQVLRKLGVLLHQGRAGVPSFVRAFQRLTTGVVHRRPLPLPYIDEQWQTGGTLPVRVVDAFEGLRADATIQLEVQGVALQIRQSGLHRLRSLPPGLQDLLDIIVRDGAALGSEDLVGAVSNAIKQLLLAKLLLLVLQSPLLHHHRIELQLLLRPLDDLLLHGVLRDEPIDVHWLRLSDAVASVLGLQVCLRVPVGVVQDARVSRLEVDTQPTGARAEEKDELLTPRRVVLLDLGLAEFVAGVAVDAAVGVVLCHAVVLHDIHHPRHLRENQDAVVPLLHLGEKLVQQDHLPAVLPQVVAQRVQAAVFDALKEVGVVAALSQLHNDVQDRAAARPRLALDGGDVSLEELPVEALLHGGHSNEQDCLRFRGQALLHVRLEPAQHERPQQLVQLADDSLLGVVVINVKVEPVVELLGACEDVREEKV